MSKPKKMMPLSASQYRALVGSEVYHHNRGMDAWHKVLNMGFTVNLHQKTMATMQTRRYIVEVSRTDALTVYHLTETGKQAVWEYDERSRQAALTADS